MYAVVKVNKEKMSSNSPCAACKFLRRKCTQECVFAPYFPPDQPQKFANVHKVYGASNVAKLLNDLPPTKREDAVNSLAYEADARHRDPVYGCVGLISILQHRLKQVQMDLENAKRELANYIGPSATLPILNHQPAAGFIQHSSVLPNYSMHPHETILGLTTRDIVREVPRMVQQVIGVHNCDREQQAEEEEQVLRNYDNQTPRSSSDLLGFNSGGFDSVSAAIQVTTSEFSHMTTTAAAMSPCLSLGGSYDNNNVYQIQHQHHHHLQPHQLFLHQQLPLQRAE
uniref:LOB domain-containing protein 36-like n=1 Tax=Erigeron canadensis TaxID=72917 RepID=UPI001CB97902|nr:LOB domain-containing protein 36-like [Erigeron canadensis]